MKGDEPFEYLFSIALSMRTALSNMCDGNYGCTCGVCRAAWSFDHYVRTLGDQGDERGQGEEALSLDLFASDE